MQPWQQIHSILRRVIFSVYPDEALKNQTDAKAAQLLLKQQYRNLIRLPKRSLPTFSDIGFRRYSQFDEDGIILYLFSIIEPQSRTCLEICAGDGIECNTANLIINHGWWGHLFDGNANNVSRGAAFYARHKDTFLYPPNFKLAWITAENINQLILNSGLHGQIDLLSLDLDGNDYWIWKALNVVEPTVVVCEIQNVIPPDLALTIPYDPSFRVATFQDDFRGASLKAMVNLGHSKGYRLVGAHRLGFNVFFVKNGVADDLLPEISPERCAADPYTRLALSTRWPKVKEKDWVRV